MIYPALHISFTPEAETQPDLRDLLLVRLDDFAPTAIEEAPMRWRVYFASRASREQALAALRSFGGTRLAVDPLDVDDEDWARRSQASLGPVRIGRIVVSPPWCLERARAQTAPDDLLIVIVPSMGFGTGHHASTRLCLSLLQEVPVRGRTVLDVGTGSGVLAIAAARLGAASVIAVDYDSDAIAAARENIALNPGGVAIALESAELGASEAVLSDIVLANLAGDVLRRTAREILQRTKPASDVIVSGVLVEERATVTAAFESAGARLHATRTEDEWVGLHFRI